MRNLFLSTVTLAALIPSPAHAQMRAVPMASAPTPSANVSRIVSVQPAPAISQSTILRGSDMLAQIKSVPILREFDRRQLTTTKSLQVGIATVDLTAIFDKPNSLPSVTRKLEKSALVTVRASDLTGYLREDGLAIRAFVNYQLKPGTCSNPASAREVAALGVPCATRQSPAARLAEYANPGSPRFVADLNLRNEAIAKAKMGWAKQDAEIAGHVSRMRAMLADPAERAKLGPDAAILDKLSDEQLTAELINQAETKIEDVMFIPKADKLDVARVQTLADDYRRKFAVPALNKSNKTNQPIDKVIFLTGFTLGRQYDWSKKIEKTISWCLIGCKETYYIEGGAYLSFGFGLRFPIQLDGKYDYEESGGKAQAYLTADVKAINGSPEQYLASGLSRSQLFEGKEAVAEVKAGGRFAYRLPVIGGGALSTPPLGKDFTEKLPAPYTYGQFTPPTPGVGGTPSIEYFFKEVDLLMNYGNWGVAGILAHPGIKLDLVSDRLAFTVHDNVANSDQELVSGRKLPLAVDPTSKMSSFSIGAPVYNLAFLVTPGVEAHAFIDLSVWSNSWDIPIWFPDLAIKLPPGGIDFACHAETICKRDYFYTAEGHTDLTGPQGAAMAGLIEWASGFQKRWTVACPNSVCKSAVTELRKGAYAAMEASVKAGADSAALEAPKAAADAKAKAMVFAAQEKVVTDATNGAKPKCSEERCPPVMDSIARQAIEEMNFSRGANDSTPWGMMAPIAVEKVNRGIENALLNSQMRAAKPRLPQALPPRIEFPGQPAPPPPPPPEDEPPPVPTPPIRVPVIKVPVIPKA